MKPFDLEKAKAGDPVVTRMGKPARIICFDRLNITYPLVALITHESGKEDIRSFTNEGMLYNSITDIYDLLMATKKITKWYNVYTTGAGNMFCSKDEALENISNNMTYLETRSVTWEA